MFSFYFVNNFSSTINNEGKWAQTRLNSTSNRPNKIFLEKKN